MASVYILFSNQLNKFYIGSCVDVSERINQHLNKTFADSFTAKATDWVLVISIDDLEYDQARRIEIHIKKMKSRKYINSLTLYPEVIEQLKEKY